VHLIEKETEVARFGGDFEPQTTRFEVWCSIRCSYEREVLSGAHTARPHRLEEQGACYEAA